MTALEILTDLRRAGVTVSIVGDKLRLKAPEGVLTEELKQRLAIQKAEIIKLLQAETASHGMPKCSHCSKFGPIGKEAGCSRPGDLKFSMAALIECSDFVMKTVH